MKSKSIVITAILLTAILFSNFISYADSDYTLSDINSQKKNLLIIHSYHQEFTWTSELHRGITNEAIENGWNVYTEYLDIYRKDDKSLELKKEQILYDYGDLNIDAIVVTDNSAYSFISSVSDTFFKDVPMVFAGLNNIPMSELLANSTGIMQKTSLKELIAFINQAKPKADRLIVAGYDTNTAKSLASELISAAKNSQSVLNILPVISSDLDEQIGRIKELTDKNSLIYVAGSFKNMNHGEYASLLAEELALPTFVGVSNAVDGQVLGGYVINPYEHGLIVNDMLQQIFSGVSVNSIPVIADPVQELKFNFNVLGKYNISEYKLPENSIVVNKPSPTITLSRYILNAIILSLFFTIVVIGFLLYAIQMRRKYTEELISTKEALMESNMDLEAHSEELLASREELDRQYKELEANKLQIQKLADYDQTTEYMNANRFISTVNEFIAVHDNTYVIYITITNLEDVSNSLGFGQFELLLHSVSINIRDLLQSRVYAFGIIKGDDIMICTYGIPVDLEQDVLKLVNLFNQPFYTDFFSIKLNAKIGIARHPHDGIDGESLIKSAGIAAINAIGRRHQKFAYYTPSMQQAMYEEQKLKAEIDLAIKDRNFVLHLQPRLAMDGSKILGYEALIRWQMPDGSLRYPGDFISLAERTGQILDIGELVVDMVCDLIKVNRLDEMDITISLNLSSQHFESTKILDILDQAIMNYGIDHGSIEIEVTESSLIKNFELTNDLLTQLQSKGFSIALDDFGTGYSSLSYIRNLPINKIKIDRSFISKIPDPKYMIVLKAVIALSKELSYKINIEGIETKEQWDLLIPLKPDELQGYYFYKPMPVEDALGLLED